MSAVAVILKRDHLPLESSAWATGAAKEEISSNPLQIGGGIDQIANARDARDLDEALLDKITGGFGIPGLSAEIGKQA
ncbi:hypothetical protein IL54_2165 [Sphingobium sp. ba1]|nr:hypothetical protein IL54_2165 [Sphingobium sp. ba1]